MSLTRTSRRARAAKAVRAAAAWAFLCVASAAAGCTPALHAEDTRPRLSGVATVVDGDGLEVAGKEIRLFGIDAPETGQYCRAVGEFRRRCGQYATVELDRIAGGKRVECVERDRDRYGRIVAVCRVDGRDLGREMVRAGWAVAYVKYSKDYVADEEYARERKVGMWSAEFEDPEMPWDFRGRTRGKR